jgi:hypothetical protein
MCVSSLHADECVSQVLLKHQSRAFVSVEFEWFGDEVVPKIGIHRSTIKGDRWIEPIHRRIDCNLFYYNFYNTSLINYVGQK